MKAALIPPMGYEHTALNSSIHLILPFEVCMNNHAYTETYAEARNRGHYLILDNGCAEGQLVDGETLMTVAQALRVHEIVAPDYLGQMTKTWNATKKWLADNPDAADYNIMAVTQGKNFRERMRLVDRYASVNEITTLGIPKVAITKHGDMERLLLVQAILSAYPNRFKIHLLGLNKEWPTEILEMNFPAEVRSMDSAQPYKLAEAGKLLDKDSAWAPRRSSYFEKYKEVFPELLLRNIEIFMDWAASNES